MQNTIEKIRVLVVDDSEVQRTHIIGMREAYGFRLVDGAINGQDALDKLQRDSYDLAFIDLEMPVMDGVELVRNIAAKALLDSVVILSSKEPSLIISVGTMAEEDGLSVLGTFQKPIQKEHLDCSVNRWHSQLEVSEIEKTVFNVPAEELDKAIREDQLELFYQPKVTSKGLIIKGVEALARWNHSELGLIPPIEFVPMAERFGLISAMTHGLLRKALSQKREWQKKGVSFHLAFNLSPLSLADKGLAEQVADLAIEYDVAPDQIVLEITENAVSGEISAAIETMARLRLKGFKIAIDDYGTGYANAQQLSRVPASELKIDRCLIGNVSTRPQQQSILKSTVSLAKDLGLNTVAEGVEHIEDLKYVQALGVDLIQGYLFAKPMPADKLKNWIAKDLAELRKRLNQQLTDV